MGALKCQPDMTPVLMNWLPESPTPALNWTGLDHVCADWDHIVQWQSDNSFSWWRQGGMYPTDLYSLL